MQESINTNVSTNTTSISFEDIQKCLDILSTVQEKTVDTMIQSLKRMKSFFVTNKMFEEATQCREIEVYLQRMGWNTTMPTQDELDDHESCVATIDDKTCEIYTGADIRSLWGTAPEYQFTKWHHITPQMTPTANTPEPRYVPEKRHDSDSWTIRDQMTGATAVECETLDALSAQGIADIMNQNDTHPSLPWKPILSSK